MQACHPCSTHCGCRVPLQLAFALCGNLSCSCCAVRDDKRSGQLVNGTNKKHMVTYSVDPSESTPVSKDISMALYILLPCSHSDPDLAAVLCELGCQEDAQEGGGQQAESACKACPYLQCWQCCAQSLQSGCN